MKQKICYWIALFLVICCHNFPESHAKRLQDIPTQDFLTPSFNLGLLNPTLFNHELFHPNPYGVEKFMVDNSGVEKSRVAKSCNLLEFGHFNPNHEIFNHT
jgi:hypothetical protein